MPTIALCDQGTGIKATELQPGVVELALGGRIGGEKDLEAPVKREAVLRVGTHAPPDPIRFLVDNDLQTGVLEKTRTRQSREPCPNHDHFHRPIVPCEGRKTPKARGRENA